VAFDKLGELMPEANSASGRVVFAAPKGEQLSSYQAEIDSTLQAINKIDGVEMAVSPFVAQSISQDGRIGLAQVALTAESALEVDEELGEMIAKILESTRESGLAAEAGGDIIPMGPPEGIMGPGEIVG